LFAMDAVPIVMLSSWVIELAGFAESLTCTLNRVVSVAVGVPVIAVMVCPVVFALFVVIAKPFGSGPLETLQE
jgi:hypothetical protein